MSNKRQAAAILPFRKTGRGNIEVFLQRRTDDAPTNPGALGFFGGGIEVNEEPMQALLREAEEELSWQPREYHFLGLYEGENARVHLFFSEVDAEFEREVFVNEGEYGRFFTQEMLEGIEKKNPLINLVLEDLKSKVDL